VGKTQLLLTWDVRDDVSIDDHFPVMDSVDGWLQLNLSNQITIAKEARTVGQKLF
jgi:hypothetical protein